MGVCLPRNKNFIASLTTLCCESGKEIPAGATGYENAAARMNEYSVEIVRIFARLIRFREEKGVYQPSDVARSSAARARHLAFFSSKQIRNCFAFD